MADTRCGERRCSGVGPPSSKWGCVRGMDSDIDDRGSYLGFEVGRWVMGWALGHWWEDRAESN